MKIKYMTCPQCGGEIKYANPNQVNYCNYCGAPLYIEDGISRSVNTTVIRDEARLKEAENTSKRLDLEMEKLKYKKSRTESCLRAGSTIAGAAAFTIGNLLKVLLTVIGIIFLVAAGLIYLISPVDVLSGLIFDDLLIVFLCVEGISHIGKGIGKR